MSYRLASKELSVQGKETCLFSARISLTVQLIQHCIQWVPLGCEIDHFAPCGAEFRNIEL
jgi:hypothetical protein